jgi:predicted alpha/beta hydrolase family esterase
MLAIVDVVVWVSAFGAGGMFVGVLVYTFGSFVLMRPHTTARAFHVSLRELVREAFLAAITQPFLPLYYFYGYRMDPLLMRRRTGRASPVPIVFVHGYMQNRVGFLGLARALAQKGIGPLYGFNYPWLASIESNAERLDRFVERVCRETGSEAVDLICHSMGGLVAMEMLRTARNDGLKVRRCVTIATPHAGVAWRGPILGVSGASLRRGSKLLEAHASYTLTLPALSVFSSHDNVVHPKETSQLVKRGGRDIEIDGSAHLAILFSAAVAERVASFLLEPGLAAPEVELASRIAVIGDELREKESEEPSSVTARGRL